jgi:hypothetical protein
LISSFFDNIIFWRYFSFWGVFKIINSVISLASLFLSSEDFLSRWFYYNGVIFSWFIGCLFAFFAIKSFGTYAISFETDTTVLAWIRSVHGAFYMNS